MSPVVVQGLGKGFQCCHCFVDAQQALLPSDVPFVATTLKEFVAIVVELVAPSQFE